jgi:sugar lactone lactonase YvrE
MLLFVDVLAGRIWQMQPRTGRIDYIEVPGPVGAVHPTAADDDSLVIAGADGIALVRGGRVVDHLATPIRGRHDVRMNDANVDPAGRYFAGTMALDFRSPIGGLYRLDLDRSLTEAVPGAVISNGVDWSPDATRCYYVDSPSNKIDVFDYEVESGALSNRRTFVDLAGQPGIPDGLTVDAAGGVWLALFGGARVCRFDPTGALTFTVHLPVDLVTSCCFGGDEFDQLFISTSTENMPAEAVAREPAAGGIFVVRTGWTGRPGTAAAFG